MTLIAGITTYFAAREAEALFRERVKIAKNTEDTAQAKAEAMKSKSEAERAKREAELTSKRVAAIEKRLREGGVPERVQGIETAIGTLVKRQERLIEALE